MVLLTCSCLKKDHLHIYIYIYIYIYIRKNNGPNTELCGTPCFTRTHLKDNLIGLPPFIYIILYLFSKYELTYLLAVPEIP